MLMGAPEGQRREIALQIAGHYLGQGIAAAEVLAILLGFAQRCLPPFPEREARAPVHDLARRDGVRTTSRGSYDVAPGLPPDDGLGLVPLGELLGAPDDAHTWVVEQRLPAAGLGLLAGKPKVGKSTAAVPRPRRGPRGAVAWFRDHPRAGYLSGVGGEAGRRARALPRTRRDGSGPHPRAVLLRPV